VRVDLGATEPVSRRRVRFRRLAHQRECSGWLRVR
jgi:hypothetical protein